MGTKIYDPRESPHVIRVLEKLAFNGRLEPRFTSTCTG